MKITTGLPLTSIRSRLILFLLLLLIPVLTAIYLFIGRENIRYTDATIESYLNIGAQVFDFSVNEHKNTLLTISNALTRDWGFRNAFGAGDASTIMDAAQNLLDRSNGAADLMLITEMNGRVIIDTHNQGFDVLPPRWEEILDMAVEHPEGHADQIVTVGNTPYQITVIPLFLPTPVAWIFAGFPLDDSFVQSIKGTTASDVSIVQLQNHAGGESVAGVIASTLSVSDRQQLAGSLDIDRRDQTQRVRLDSGEYGALLRTLGIIDNGDVQIVAVIQRSYRENEANLRALQDRLLNFSIAVVCASLLAVIWLARTFTQPALRLARRVARIEQGDYSPATLTERVTGKDEVADLARGIENMASGLADKERVRDLLGKVVSHEIADELLRGDFVLGGEEKQASILFADIQGFTAISEQLPPDQVLQLLNGCFARLCAAIDNSGGVVDKFMGDALMAIFGAPISHHNDCERAVKALLSLRQLLPEISRLSPVQNYPLKLSFGLNTGSVIAGNMGSPERLNYTVIGDGVNLASRLESLTRVYGVDNLVSGHTLKALGTNAADYVWRNIDLVAVYGKQEVVSVHQLCGLAADAPDDVIKHTETFNRAVSLYQQKQWPQALSMFEELQAAAPESLYELYINRLLDLISRQPADWQPVFAPDFK